MARHDPRTLTLVHQAKERTPRGTPTLRAEQAFSKLMKDLEPEIRKLSSRYYINGAEKEDVWQEGRIGVWKAIDDFDENGGMSFRNFSINLCSKRNVITAMMAANRKKNELLNASLPLELSVSTSDDDNEQTLADFIQDANPPMIDSMMIIEEYDELYQRAVRRFTQLEKAIYEERKHDESYRTVAEALGISPKAVDKYDTRSHQRVSM